MHPILSRPGRLILYVAAWTPIAVLIALAVAFAAGLRIGTSLQIMVPSTEIYGIACLSSWYTCRVLHLERSRLSALLVTHGASAVFASGVWTALVALAGQSALGAPAEWGQFASRGVPVIFVSGAFLYLLSVALHYVLLAAEASQQAKLREKDALALARQAELGALKAQVNPHFLFNSLNSISALVSVDPARAREMCVLLGEFLRRTLGLGEQSAIPLSEELALARRFLDVEKVRFGARMRVEEEVQPDAQRCVVPPLLLQPLVENAVKHGVAALTEGGWIRLEARREDGELRIAVANNCDPDSVGPRREGLGLVNVRRRLEAIYGGRAALTIAATPERYQAELILPAEEA